MRGSITKKKSNGLYYPIIYLGADPLTGKKKYKWGHGYKVKKDAETELRTLLNAYDEHDEAVLFIGHQEHASFTEVFTKWKEIVRNEGLYESGTSYDTCIGNIQKHIIPQLGEARIDKIELKHIRQVFSSMEKSDGTPLSNATKKKILGTLRHVFEYGIESGWCTENPCKGLNLKTPDTPPKTIWTPEEITYFLEWVKVNREYHYYLAFLILATTAGRRGEITAIRYQDLMDEGLFITRSAKTNGEVKDTKTGSSGRRVVMLFDEVQQAIEVQRKRQEQAIEKYGNKSGIQDSVKPWDRILTDKYNNPVRPQYLSREFKRCISLINEEGNFYLPPMPMKNLRHSFATIGLQNGVNVPDMQRQLGHSRASTTQNSYNQYAETMQKANRDKMERLYFGRKSERENLRSERKNG